MSLFRDIYNRSKRHRFKLIATLTILYFVYHGIQGERGFLAYLRLNKQIKEAEHNLEGLQQQRDQLEHRTKLLRPENLDGDLLEEQARWLLHYGRDNEFVIFDNATVTPSHTRIDGNKETTAVDMQTDQ